MAEYVQLDGLVATTPWPLELAVSLLEDPAAWGLWWPGHPENHLPNRYADFTRLALQVTAYTRHPPASAWRNPLKDDDLSRTFASYSTQDLLDGLFFAARGDHFCYGFIRSQEPQLRLIVQEVVRRVLSEDPPHFEVKAAPSRNS